MNSASCSHNDHHMCDGTVIRFPRGRYGQADYRYTEACDCCTRGHQEIPKFGGSTYSEPRDGVRLNRQSQIIFDFMKSGEWWTLSAISDATGEPEASISARLRDFRKVEFGGHKVERQYVDKGLWKYRLLTSVAQ